MLLVLLFPCGCVRTPPDSGAKTKVTHLVIISIDGLRPDLLLRASTPNIHRLMREGSFTMWAQTTDVALTLPSHVSMLTGVVPERHDIWWDYDVFYHFPAVPTLFELAKQRGLTTAMSCGKQKFVALAKPGTLDWSYVPEVYANNTQVSDGAVAYIEQHQPNVLFVHMPDADAFGHGNGWGSPQQLDAIAKADAGVGKIISALRRRDLLRQTVIIVTADHGGAGYDHGGTDPRSRHIPWIISGPGIKRNFDLTICPDLVVHTEDTFATACFLLDIPRDEDLDGKAISQAFEE